MPAKSAVWNASSSSSATDRSASDCARINRRITSIRSGAKNICSVRHSPIPSAPNARARSASAGVSAFVRTPIRRNRSAQCSSWCACSSSPATVIGRLAQHDLAGQAIDGDDVSPSRTVVPLALEHARSAGRSPAQLHPVTAGSPIPRATTAACEVMPPRAVRMPRERSIPGKSSAAVSCRTRMTASPASPSSRARSGVSATCPVAAPGLAGIPVAITVRSNSGSICGCSSASISSGRTRAHRGRLVDQTLLRHIDRHPHRRRRGPLAGAGLQHPELAPLDRELQVLHIGVMPFQQLADRQQLLVRLPEHRVVAHLLDRQAACAPRKPHPRPAHSAGIRRTCPASPVLGLRVNATPDAHPAPRLPNTIACTVTAVPPSSRSPVDRR